MIEVINGMYNFTNKTINHVMDGRILFANNDTKELFLWTVIKGFDWLIFGVHADFNHSQDWSNIGYPRDVCQRRNAFDAGRLLDQAQIGREKYWN